MNYPLISEYIESTKSEEDNFEELSDLRPGNVAILMYDADIFHIFAARNIKKEHIWEVY